jgi:hypothetical protein
MASPSTAIIVSQTADESSSLMATPFVKNEGVDFSFHSSNSQRKFA